MLACGLATLDVVQTVDHVPAPDEKLVATNLHVAAGGPAANAAVTAALLGAPTRLVTRIGRGALGSVVAADLAAHDVEVLDLAPAAADPPVSTVLVTRSTGERAVVSVNGMRLGAPSGTASSGTASGTAPSGTESPPAVPGAAWDGIVVVLLDGHHLDLAEACAREARARGLPVLLDGGSWKPGLEAVLPLVDVAVLSADFTMPGAGGDDDLLRAVRAAGPGIVAQSHGRAPVRVLGPEDGVVCVTVPPVTVVDTLGAGDVLHGALAAWLAAGSARLSRHDAVAGLAWAVQVASASCTAAGARGWADDGARLSGWRTELADRTDRAGRGGRGDRSDRGDWGDRAGRGGRG